MAAGLICMQHDNTYYLEMFLLACGPGNCVLNSDVLIHSVEQFQAIEAQDPSHQCVEYWHHKEVVSESSGSANDDYKFTNGSSNSLGDIKTKLFGFDLIKQEQDNIGGSFHSFEEMKSLLQGFLKKATPAELSAMHKLFSSDAQVTQWRAAFTALIDEIQKGCR